MGTITTGVGLISGIDIAGLIDSLISLESRGRVTLENRVGVLRSQQTALLDLNARLLNLKNAAGAFRVNSIFGSARATSSNEEALTAAASTGAQPGTFKFIVRQLVSTSQLLSAGRATRDASPLGLDSISFEFGNGRLARDRALEELNGGQGIDRGKIVLSDGGSSSVTVDLTDVTNIDEVLDRINANGVLDVTATVDDDHLVVTENGGGALTISNGLGDTTATDLGIAGSAVGGVLTGTSIYGIAGTTALRDLNDGAGVLVRSNVNDLAITARNGDVFNIDLGRIDNDITGSILLEDLNDGQGLSIDGDPDTTEISFVDRDGTTHDVDLSGLTTVQGLIDRIDVETGGKINLQIVDGDHFKVVDTTGGSGLLKVLGTDDAGTTVAEELGILEETGVSADEVEGEIVPTTIDLPAVTTLQEVVDRINSAQDETLVDNGGRIVASIGAAGLEIQDTTGGAGNLIITSTSTNPHAAADLGLDTGAAGVASDTVTGRRLLGGIASPLVDSLNGGRGLTASLAATTALADLFHGRGLASNGDGLQTDISITDRLGNAYEIEVDGLVTVQDLIDAVDTATGGNVTLAIDGQALRATDSTGGTGVFQIADINGSNAVADLGLEVNTGVSTVLGVDTQPLITTDLSITNRGGTTTLIDLSAAETVQDLIDTINAAGAGVTAALNSTGNGLLITDTTGLTAANLQISGDYADALGIAADVAANSVRGSNAQLRYVSHATRLEDLNDGRGIGKGTFRITDGLGQTAVVDIGGTEETLYDVIQEINSRGLAVRARVNDNGDGLLIEEDPTALGGTTPFVPIKVASVTGTAAADLNIVGESADVVGASIDGSYERVVDLATSDSLDDVVAKINAAKIPVSAAVINSGSGATPYRLNLTSGISGRTGDLVVDTGGVDLGLTALSEGRDAKVFFGAGNPSTDLLLTSPTNTLDDVLAGVTIDLLATSDDPVTVTVARDEDAVVSAMTAMVTAFNDVIDRMDAYDFYNVDTEEKGILLGDPTVSRIRSSLYRVATGQALNVSGPYRYLGQLGITIDGQGHMKLDEAHFRDVYARDPDAVEAALATYETSAGEPIEISPGITAGTTELSYDALGFGNLFDRLLGDLTNSIDGTVKLAGDAFESQITLLEDRIDTMDKRLAARRDQLTRQFTNMETVLAKLQSQMSSLSSISTSLSQIGASFGTG